MNNANHTRRRSLGEISAEEERQIYAAAIDGVLRATEAMRISGLSSGHVDMYAAIGEAITEEVSKSRAGTPEKYFRLYRDFWRPPESEPLNRWAIILFECPHCGEGQMIGIAKKNKRGDWNLIDHSHSGTSVEVPNLMVKLWGYVPLVEVEK